MNDMNNVNNEHDAATEPEIPFRKKWLPWIIIPLSVLFVAAAITITTVIIIKNHNDTPDTEFSLEGDGSEISPYILRHSGTYIPYADEGRSLLFLYYPSQTGVISVTAVNRGEVGILMTDLTTGETIHTTDEAYMGVSPGNGVLIELYFVNEKQKGNLPFVFVDEKDGAGYYHESPTVITGTGTYPTDLTVGKSAHYVYTATDEGFIRVDASGTMITIRNTTTGAVFMAPDGLSVSVRPGDRLEIELRGEVGMQEGTVNMFFKDEKDHIDPSETAFSVKAIRRYEQNGSMVTAAGDTLAILPGQTIRYEVGAVNTGTCNAWVRVRVTFAFKDKEGREIPCTEEEIDGLISPAIDTEHWIRVGDDGWWYYDRILLGNCTAPLLFDHLTMSGENFTSKFAGGTVEMYVTVEGVQSKGNGTSPADVTGWPET